jgi:hypothetical protein
MSEFNIKNKLTEVSEIFRNFATNSYVTTFIILFFITYGSAIGSGGKPPKFILDLFGNPIARILLLAIVVYEINHNIQLALLMALVFYLTQQYIFKQESFSQIKSLEQYQNMFYINKMKTIETPLAKNNNKK